MHCAHLTNLHNLQPSQNFMICDAGGGTVDLAIYKLIGNLSHLEIAEVCARSGANWFVPPSFPLWYYKILIGWIAVPYF